MKKTPVRIVKKSSLDVSDKNSSSENSRRESRLLRNKISSNVMNWIDELRERKTIETIQSFDMLAKVSR